MVLVLQTRLLMASLGIFAIVSVACGPTSATDNPVQPTEPVTLLTSDTAVSILRSYLIDCKLGPGAKSYPDEISPDWWNLDNWDMSARYYGMSEWGNVNAPNLRVVRELEAWVVTGPGLDRLESGDLARSPGTWMVYAGERVAVDLDSAARLAHQEFMNKGDLNLYLKKRFCSPP